jgi:hypothetical protein
VEQQRVIGGGVEGFRNAIRAFLRMPLFEQMQLEARS